MDRRRALVAISLGSAFLLAGCASPQWTRSDSSPAQGEQDQLACQQQAKREVSLQPYGFYGSLSELYGQNSQPQGRGMARGIGAAGPMFDIDPVHRMLEEDRIADACMRARGYTPQEPAIKPSSPVRRSSGSSA